MSPEVAAQWVTLTNAVANSPVMARLYAAVGATVAYAASTLGATTYDGYVTARWIAVYDGPASKMAWMQYLMPKMMILHSGQNATLDDVLFEAVGTGNGVVSVPEQRAIFGDVLGILGLQSSASCTNVVVTTAATVAGNSDAYQASVQLALQSGFPIQVETFIELGLDASTFLLSDITAINVSKFPRITPEQQQAAAFAFQQALN
jgi:hypothetical protein